MSRKKGDKNIQQRHYVVSIHIYEITGKEDQEVWEMIDMYPLLDAKNYSRARTMYNRHIKMTEKRRIAAKNRDGQDGQKTVSSLR